jgi:uncharacterized protein (TIGR03086 family)
MSKEMIVDLGPAARRLAGLVAATDPADLGKPTPCPAYRVGDLLEHIGGLALEFAGAARKDPRFGGDAPPGDAARLAADWPQRIPGDLAALARAWQEPDAWTGMTRIGGAETPGQVVGLVLADELVVHGWDLARGTGQEFDAEPEVLEAARSFLAMFATPDAPAGPEVAFGPARLLGDDAPLLDRVVALAGRNPAWPAGGADGLSRS